MVAVLCTLPRRPLHAPLSPSLQVCSVISSGRYSLPFLACHLDNRSYLCIFISKADHLDCPPRLLGSLLFLHHTVPASLPLTASHHFVSLFLFPFFLSSFLFPVFPFLLLPCFLDRLSEQVVNLLDFAAGLSFVTISRQVPSFNPSLDRFLTTVSHLPRNEKPRDCTQGNSSQGTICHPCHLSYHRHRTWPTTAPGRRCRPPATTTAP